MKPNGLFNMNQSYGISERYETATEDDDDADRGCHHDGEDVLWILVIILCYELHFVFNH